MFSKTRSTAGGQQSEKNPSGSVPIPGASKVFLLSPANIAGIRGRLLLNENAEFELARRLRKQGASLGETFSFVSGLYFRGKLSYARAFAAPPPGAPGVSVITACGGLVSPQTTVGRERLREISAVDLDIGDTRYCGPLVRDATVLASSVGPECQVVLLGSIATGKYLEPLVRVFGERLRFPAEFVGRGDLSRGGLMLRCAQAGTELTYVPVTGTLRHGPRPPRLAPAGNAS